MHQPSALPTYAVLDDLVKKGKIRENYATAEDNYIKAVKKGLFKIMAKMGISTIRSYRGAKIFESIGLSEGLLKAYFGTEVSTIGGIGLETIARDAINLHNLAFAKNTNVDFLPNLGQFHYRKDGIEHAWNPGDDCHTATRHTYWEIRYFQEIHQSGRPERGTDIHPRLLRFQEKSYRYRQG